MKKVLVFIACLHMLLLASCDVHELPLDPDFVKLHLQLEYQTDMTEWKYSYEDGELVEKGMGKTYDNRQESGMIRYVVRTYPVSEKQRAMPDYVQEFVYTKDVADGYNYEATLDLLPGNYVIMVWSDLVKSSGDSYFYNAGNFAEVMLQGDHQGNDNHRDAFYGKTNVSLYPNDTGQCQDSTSIVMNRPLAKFEIVANDLSVFLGSTKEETDQYKVKIQYIGFMPDACSLFTGNPVDSSTGVAIESSLKELSDDEASMGFDYVFAGDKETTVTIRIGVYDNDGKETSMTGLLEIPVKPNYHTILTGNFLMQKTSGGINISPGYDGNYNLIIPW